MESCKHRHLVLLPNSIQRLRCRHCHLTIKSDELDRGYCPECYEAKGVKRNDFETVKGREQTRYRCEDCNTIIEYTG